MLKAALCLIGIVLIVCVAEVLYRRKILRGEYQRKFIHITSGTFIAFWPWLISFKSIEVAGALLVVGSVINHWLKAFHYSSDLNRHTYGDIFFALAILLTSLATHNKLFFALAILNMALADGLAAVVGQKYGKNWRYMILTHTKTVIGSMTFWLISLCIFGVGLLFSPVLMPHYFLLILLLPPLLAILENFPGLGSDNIFVPIVVVLILNLATRA